MSYQPLHHKYRPQTFAELVGQEAIAATLTNAVSSDRIAPAYLFAGPRGTGKTSSARILAKSLNCLESTKPTANPCGVCEVCRAIAVGSAMDVIEIDAASNTGVDNIRDLIERAQFAPVQCRYKVYAIDECHMLSVAAFNALLKTLEEPPQRVVFILATTDPQRVLPTIISRTQRFDFRRIRLSAMVNHLSKIAQLEKININSEAIKLVAQIANGGLRDAQSLLDQLSLLSGEITSDRVWDLVGAVSELDLLALLASLRSKQPDLLLQQCRALIDRGREPLIILQNLANFYLNLAIAKTAPQSLDLVAVTGATWQKLQLEAKFWSLENILRAQKLLKDSEYQIKNSNVPRLWLEITLLDLLPSPDLLVNQTAVSTPANTTPKPLTTNNSRQVDRPKPIKKYPKIIRTKPINPPEEIASNKKQLLSNSDSLLNEAENLHKLPLKSETKNDSSVVPLPLNSEPAASQNVAKLERDSETIATPNLEDLWQKVIENIQLSAIKPIIKSQCQLLDSQASSATVEIESDRFYGMLRSYIKEIEAAFTKVLDRKITVKLQVKKNSTVTAIDLPVSKTIPINSLKKIPPADNLQGDRTNFPRAPQDPKIIAKPDNLSFPQDEVDKQKPTKDNSDDRDLEEDAVSFAKFFDGKVIDFHEPTADLGEELLVEEEKIPSSNNSNLEKTEANSQLPRREIFDETGF